VRGRSDRFKDKTIMKRAFIQELASKRPLDTIVESRPAKRPRLQNSQPAKWAIAGQDFRTIPYGGWWDNFAAQGILGFQSLGVLQSDLTVFFSSLAKPLIRTF
jgi:hypothetical protein